MSLAALLAAPAVIHAQSAPKGFTSLFDGKTLKGWRGDTTIWSVRDGAISGGSETRLPFNTYLIYDKPYANFELRYKYRWLTPEGNSGFQFRSGIADGHYALAGYQANVVPATVKPERYGMLYAELTDRQEIALLGQKVELTRRTATGGGTARIVRTVKEMVNSRDDLMASVRANPEWNEVVVIAYGNRIVSSLNGLLAFDALDKDPLAPSTGLLGLQAHSGPPMMVQYKDIYIKPLKSEPNFTAGFKSTRSAAPAPVQTYKDSVRAGLDDVGCRTSGELTPSDWQGAC
ncbi:DUF1080 domain-containing protein [uncultured Sphingomonas sp.]|uniref:3-keto-disaccharide hydrolase n=1 Tax=uncultured Sphingomonas sp. TaxID=158754 RepID=UPI002603D7DB|nr:DUF1080 domain-containing protein [uncultured Sphingomonas sp.]